jgi:hypothetical protein
MLMFSAKTRQETLISAVFFKQKCLETSADIRVSASVLYLLGNRQGPSFRSFRREYRTTVAFTFLVAIN